MVMSKGVSIFWVSMVNRLIGKYVFLRIWLDNVYPNSVMMNSILYLSLHQCIYTLVKKKNWRKENDLKNVNMAIVFD